jgi:hypothetical protein
MQATPMQSPMQPQQPQMQPSPPAYGAPQPQMQPSPPAYGAPQPAPVYGAPQPQPQPMMPAAPYGAPQPPMGAPPYGQPGMQPGMQQQPQQGMGLPQIGIGGIGRGGTPRISVGGGDFSPAKLVGAITTGQGFNAPRKMGLTMVGVGFAFAVVNTILVLVMHLYYPYLYSIGAIFWWAGVWLTITGQPAARPDGSQAPMWGRIGLAISLVFGVLAGVSMIFFDWEQLLVR